MHSDESASLRRRLAIECVFPADCEHYACVMIISNATLVSVASAFCNERLGVLLPPFLLTISH